MMYKKLLNKLFCEEDDERDETDRMMKQRGENVIQKRKTREMVENSLVQFNLAPTSNPCAMIYLYSHRMCCAFKTEDSLYPSFLKV